MFKCTWAVASSMYGARFQMFCERRLKFTEGAIVFEIGLKVPCEALAGDGKEEAFRAFLDTDESDELLRFNLLEKNLVSEFLSSDLDEVPRGKQLKETPPSFGIYPIRIRIDESPVRDHTAFSFNIGFVIVGPSMKAPGHDTIRFFRVHSHLRNTGLARRALFEFLSLQRFGKLKLYSDRVPKLVSHVEQRRFERIYESVIREIMEINISKESPKSDDESFELIFYEPESHSSAPEDEFAWSVNSALYHRPDCADVGKIDENNMRRGQAPKDKRPHGCVEGKK